MTSRSRSTASAWNPVERTWDCPCHGSRYDAYGRVTHGPAVHDLASIGD